MKRCASWRRTSSATRPTARRWRRWRRSTATAATVRRRGPGPRSWPPWTRRRAGCSTRSGEASGPPVARGRAIGTKGHGMDSTLVVRALGLAILALLAFVCLRTLEPFVGACLWGVTLAVAAWPARVRLTRALGGRRKLAAGAIVAALVLVLVAPLAVLAVSLADQVDRVSGLLRDLAGFRLPPPPAFLAGLPAVGGAAVAEWRWAGDHAGGLVARAEPYAAATGTWFL